MISKQTHIYKRKRFCMGVAEQSFQKQQHKVSTDLLNAHEI